MKRAIRVLTVILVVLEAVLPCGKWGLQLIGYTLEPFSYVGYAWLLAVISAVVLFLRLFKKDESDGVLCVFLMPLSLLRRARVHFVLPNVFAPSAEKRVDGDSAFDLRAV